MRITISGPIGSGKSTVGKIIAKKLDLPFFSGGSIFREQAKKHGMTVEEFNTFSETHRDIDIDLDNMQLNYLREHGDIVFESRLAGWLCSSNGIDALKIFLDASENVRFTRVRNRENPSDDDTLRNLMRSRERSEHIRYQELYGLDYNDHSFYDLYINTDDMLADEVAEIAIRHCNKIQ
ncbi:MAG: AAA family ATPase [Candidatus Thermoplasmatota archaeon]|nr:AAA family ATPase [Candidatus Thermoplasmatota archaeon]